MTILGASEYHVFARWTLGATGYAVGTVDELRAGTWYDGRLRLPPELGVSFGDALGLQRATDVTLQIADGPNGNYRAMVAAGGVDGAAVTVDLVLRTRAPEGTVSEVVQSQQLTITGAALRRDGVELHLVDLEEEKLGVLYPAQRWTVDDWPALAERDAGKPVCYPVGVALKLPCVLLRADPANNEWWYAVCGGTARRIAIIDNTFNAIAVAENINGVIDVGEAFLISGGGANNGRYTVSAIDPGGGFFLVAPNLPAIVKTGEVRFMPHPRTVYRNGRVADPTEYTVQHLRTRGVLANGDFANGLAGWVVWYYTTAAGYTTTNPGAGSGVSTAGGKCTITSVSAANFCYAEQYYAGNSSGVIGSVIAVQVTVDAGGTDASVGGKRCPAGKTTTVLLTDPYEGGGGSLVVRVWGDAGTTTVSKIRFVPIDATLLKFTAEQIDFQGSPYVIEADVRGVESRNAADEVQRLLTACGLSADAASFAAARSTATLNRMLLDCDYGRGGQRKVKAILDDLLPILRGGLSRTAAGTYALWQDKAGTSLASYDETAGESLAVESVSWAGRPKTIGLRYRPSPRDPGELQNTITRAVTAGLLGDETPRELRYLRDHEAADRLLSYQAARRRYNGMCQATIYRAQYNPGDVLTLSSALNWPGARDWLVRSVRRIPNGNALELVEYNAQVHTYVPSASLPADATGDYQPDYSKTPPAAPTALKITAVGVALAQDGTSMARATVQCLPPAVNWAQIAFACIHNTTGEVVLGQGGSIGGGLYGTTLSGLRAGEIYQLKAYAINATNVQGILQATFDATAIGGGAATTTFTTPGYAALPPNVASCTARQGTGTMVVVDWPAVAMASDALAEYVLERSNNGGAYAETWRGRATTYSERSPVSYGGTVQYRVRARDRWGNLSGASATSNVLTLASNIRGGVGSIADVMDSTIGTVNRSGVTTVSIPFAVPLGNSNAWVTATHSLGKQPVAGAVAVPSALGVGATLSSATSTQISILVFRQVPVNTDIQQPSGANHIHSIFSAAAINGTASVDIW